MNTCYDRFLLLLSVECDTWYLCVVDFVVTCNIKDSSVIVICLYFVYLFEFLIVVFFVCCNFVCQSSCSVFVYMLS